MSLVPKGRPHCFAVVVVVVIRWLPLVALPSTHFALAVAVVPAALVIEIEIPGQRMHRPRYRLIVAYFAAHPTGYAYLQTAEAVQFSVEAVSSSAAIALQRSVPAKRSQRKARRRMLAE